MAGGQAEHGNQDLNLNHLLSAPFRTRPCLPDLPVPKGILAVDGSEPLRGGSSLTISRPSQARAASEPALLRLTAPDPGAHPFRAMARNSTDSTSPSTRRCSRVRSALLAAAAMSSAITM